MRNSAEDLSIIIKTADKGSCVVIWDREDYLAEGYKQLSDHSTYTDVEKFNQKLVSDLTYQKVPEFLRDCAIRNLSQKKS